jgi:hypothetical protein
VLYNATVYEIHIIEIGLIFFYNGHRIF